MRGVRVPPVRKGYRYSSQEGGFRGAYGQHRGALTQKWSLGGPSQDVPCQAAGAAAGLLKNCK